MESQFIHLHLHTEYSLVDGLCRIKPLLDKAKALNMQALAITDHCNLFALVKFYKAAISKGIKPIIGADCLLQSATGSSKLVFLCQNNQGYLNLTRLISRAYVEGQIQAIPYIKPEWLTVDSMAGLLVLVGQSSEVGQLILAQRQDEACALLQQWQQIFPQRLYLEIARVGHEHEKLFNQTALNLAQQLNLPVVATNNVRFVDKDDHFAHEARVCIHSGYTLNDEKRPKATSKQQYLRSPEEMQNLFADVPGALINSVEIAKRCNVTLTLNQYSFPQFPIPEGDTTETYFARLAELGLQKRLQFLYGDDASLRLQKTPIYIERLQRELKVISDMGFAGYFLIVADFIQWAKDQDIPVGPGRGSGAGSLVAYALNITDLDPFAYDLLFERFLNPERVSLPDFDIDFCMDKRDRVIDYVANRYGRESVSQIITFGTMAAKAVVRDVGRALGHPYGFVDKIAKLIPFELGITLEKALAQEEALSERYTNDEDVKELIDLARKLEGITRNAGKHAGGVVISPSLLTDYSPLYCEEGGLNLVTQFDKDDVEAVGLVKFDFLGLRTLTIIDWAIKIVKQQAAAKNLSENLDITRIPLEDVATFKLLKECKTTAVFQLESRGMKELIKRLQPDCFEDIIALVALFRPGPLQSGMVDDFINRKHGRAKVEYAHPELEPILKPTYGVILYQEQVMQIAQVLAGYTLGGADLLRRAMGKKKPEEMAKQREIFVAGAVGRGVKEDIASYIFDLMEKFAGYGFNKSHSAAYALVSYQTAWLKTHYPEAFMAAVLSSDMDNTDKVVTLIEECRSMGISVLPPSVNYSQYRFTVTPDGKILYGLGAIKGVGEAAIEGIIAARPQQGEFPDLFAFCQRVITAKANRRVLEALIRAGACDDFKVHRASLMASLEKALKLAEQSARDASIGQTDLFSELIFADSDAMDVAYVDVPQWDDHQRLLGEKETLGLYLTGHPLENYLPELKQFTSCRLKDIRIDTGKNYVVAGLVISVRTIKTKKGKRMAIVTLDDISTRMEVAVMPETYEKFGYLLQKDDILIVEGEASLDNFTGAARLRCKKVMNLSNARQLYAKRVVLQLNSQKLPTDFADILTELLQRHSGECALSVDYSCDDVRARLHLGRDWAVRPDMDFLAEIKQQFGDGVVAVLY